MPRGTEIAGKVMGKVKGARQALTGGSGIFERLATEHGEISTMIRRVSVSGHDSKVRSELFPRIRRELLAHARAEEREIYASFRAIPELAEHMERSADEHHQIERLLDELNMMPVTDDAWITKLREMMKLVQRHVMDEELTVFPKAKKSISRGQSEELEGRYLRAKEAEYGTVS
jgi:hemerythrin superfamily protein